MSSFKKKDFIFEEDFLISAECEDCGYLTEDEDEVSCPECGGDLINETSHEDCTCAICGGHLDMWEDAYRNREDTDILICKECYAELGDE